MTRCTLIFRYRAIKAISVTNFADFI
jgi:hypothetical protein